MEQDMSEVQYKVVDGQRIPMDAKDFDGIATDNVAMPEYVANRIGAPEATNKDNIYPSIDLQLDMLWHDIDNGLFGDQAKTGTFYNAILNVKQHNPKT